jgi:hypothetical protein
MSIQINDYLASTIPIYQVVRPDVHLGYSRRDDDATLAAREGLFVYMGM